MTNRKPAPLKIKIHVTTCRLFARATVDDLEVCFENQPAGERPTKLTPGTFVATAAFRNSAEISPASLAPEVMAACAAALNTELAELIEIAKPRKLTFAQVQRIYGRAVG